MMGDFVLTSMSDVGCPFAVYPEWSFRDQESLIQSRHRTQDGSAYHYLWGKYEKFQLPLRYVNSMGQALINQWWRDGHEVAFTLNSSETVSTVLCRFVNDTKPINRFVQPYQTLFEGMVRLEAIDDAPRTGRPFILDEDVFGLLDQSYNALIG